VDEAGELRVARVHAQRDRIADGKVEDAIKGIRRTARIVRAGQVRGEVSGQLAQIGLVSNELDRAADGTGAVQRALGTAQDLHSPDIGQVVVDEQRDIIDVSRHQRYGQIRAEVTRALVRGVQAADDQVAVRAVRPGTQVGGHESGDHARETLQVLDARVLDL